MHCRPAGWTNAAPSTRRRGLARWWKALRVSTLLFLSAAAPHSGYDDASPAVRAMQDDDGANPAMLWVAAGRALWDQPAGPAAQSCRTCHGPPESLRGTASRHPATLEARINWSRTTHQAAPALPEEGEAMLSLAALVGLQSRGLPVAAERDGAVAAGEALFTARMGQLNLSCADCHDGLAGGRLGGARIPQGRVNAYPEYRLEWQGMGGLFRRIRNCMTGVRAEPFPAASAEMASLRAYLGWRTNGLPVETPGVRP